MTAEGLLAELRRLGVEIRADGERLSYRAPKGVITEEIRSLLAEWKMEILAVLRKGDQSDVPTVVPDPARRHEPFPLTDIQQAYLIGQSGSLTLGNVACHAYQEYDGERLDLERFTRALRRVVKRHDALRLIVLPNGRQQILNEVPPYRIDVVDLRALAAAAVQARLAEIRRQISHQLRPPDRWPLFDIRAALLDGGRVRLYISFDLLIGDAWSFLRFLRELFSSYEHPERDLPALELSFRDCVLAEVEFKKSDRYRRAQEYWWARLGTLPPAPELPLAKRPTAITKPEFVRRTMTIGAPEWGRLKTRATRAGLTPSGVVCAAFAEVLATWSKSARFTLNLTLFNRLLRHPEIDEVMGDFTSTLLLEIDASEPTFEKRAQRLQEQLWQDLEHRHVSGISVLRELSARKGTMPQPMPIVFSSTLIESRQVTGEEIVTPLRGGYGVSQTPQVLLDHQVFEDAGALVLNWDAVEEAFLPGMLDEMAGAYHGLLLRLADEESTWRQTIRLIPEPKLELDSMPNAQEVEARQVVVPAPTKNNALAGTLKLAGESKLLERINGYVQSVLDTRAVEPESNFLQLGATSIDMIRIVNLMDRELGFRPSIERFYRDPTVTGLLSLYEEAHHGGRERDEADGSNHLNGAKSFSVVVDTEEREAFKKRQPGLRRGEEGQAVYPFISAELGETERHEYLHRRSRREFLLNPIPIARVGEFLSCLQQRTIDGHMKYRYGSAGGLYPVQTYCYFKAARVADLPEGLYYYHPVEHHLRALALGASLDRETYDLLINRPIFDRAAFALFLVARLSAITPMYGESSLHYATLEAGAMSQLLETVAPNYGLGLCQVSALDFQRIRHLFALEESDVLVHSLLGGAIAETRSEENEASEGSAREMKLLEEVKRMSTEEVRMLLQTHGKAEA